MEYREEAVSDASNIVRDFLLGYRKHSSDHLIPDLRLEDIPMLDIRPGILVEEDGAYDAEFDDPKPRLRWERLKYYSRTLSPKTRSVTLLSGLIRGWIYPNLIDCCY